jgi:hypothetical protein
MTELSSTFKDDLTTLVNAHYETTVSILEVWSNPTLRESADPSYRKLTVTMSFSEHSVTYFAVVPDESQESVDKAYARFLGSMTNSLNAGRNPFGA